VSVKHTATKLSAQGPRGRFNRRQVVKTAGAASAAAAGGLFGPGPLPIIRRRAAAQAEPLQFWQFYAPGGQVGTQVTWFEEMVASWNEQNEQQVELVYIPSQEYIDGTRLATAFASGEGPDIFIISPGDFLRYYNGGVLQDLTPYMEQEAIDDFFPDVLASRQVDGQVYGLPMEVEPMAFYYSVAAFEEAGLSESDVPATWEELLALAEQLSTPDRFGVLFDTSPGYYQNFTWYPFMWQGGAEIALEDGVTSGLRDPGAVQALQFWQDAIESGVAPRSMLGNGGGDIVANLGANYCAIQNVGIWGISAMRENAPDFEYGVFPLPLPPGGVYTTDLGGWAFVANAQGRNPDIAGEFCAWALGSMSDDSIDRVVDWCINAKSDMPPRQSVVDRTTEMGGYESGPLQIFRDEILPGGRAEPRVTPEVYRPIADAIQAVMLNGADAQEAGEQAAQQIEAFLAGYQGAPIL